MKHLYSLVSVQLGITAWLCSTLSNNSNMKYVLILLLTILEVSQLLFMINSKSYRKLIDQDKTTETCPTCHDKDGKQFVHMTNSKFTGWYKSYDGKLISANYCPDCGQRLSGNKRSEEGVSLKYDEERV